MFVAAGGAALLGIIVISQDDDETKPTPKPKTQPYDDAYFRQAIANQEDEIYQQESKVDRLWDEYSYLPSWDIEQMKDEMRREIENEIAEDKQKLADIDRMIARINEIELQSRKE